MKKIYKSKVPRDKNGRFLLKHEENTLFFLGFAMVLFSSIAFIFAMKTDIIWLGILLGITIFIGIILMSINQILDNN